MATVTQRIKEIKQPRGGYLPVSQAIEVNYGGPPLTSLYKETIRPTLMGVVIDYLTRFCIEDIDASEAFDIALMGGLHLAVYKESKEIAYKIKNALDRIDNGETLSDNLIKNACYLSSMDTVYRAGPESYNEADVWEPDAYTITVIRELVNRSIHFFTKEDKILYTGFDLIESSHGKYIDMGDGDFITKKGLWDMKVSKNPPTTQYTLQILIYYLMGLKSDNIKKDVKKLDKIGLYNPRLNTAYFYKTKDIDDKVIDDVSKKVIGY